MSHFQFTKMQGLGNDFVVIDTLRQQVNLTPKLIRLLADRRYGIGCDQILVIGPAPNKDTDFSYTIFNADGTQAEQCGNGARCVARFLQDEQLTDKTEIKLATVRDVTTLYLEVNGLVRVNMGIPRFDPASLPYHTTQTGPHYQLTLNHQSIDFYALSLGNPHVVITVSDLTHAPVSQLGPAFNQHPDFPQGVNVGFMQIISRDLIHLRVYERGAGETLACGTGACAAIVAARLNNQVNEQALVQLPGGSLSIAWKDEHSPIWMTGPATTVFKGLWTITK